jgi:hypothetical protein
MQYPQNRHPVGLQIPQHIDADLLKRYRDLGAVRVSVSLPAENAQKTLPVLDRWAKLIRQVNG